MTNPESSKQSQSPSKDHPDESPFTGSPPASDAPHRLPSNWQFCILLHQVRQKRKFTIQEASQCLPGVTNKVYEEWESGKRIPLSAIQTYVIWKLNTAPRPRPASSRRHDRGSVLSNGLPLAAFAATALGTLVYHFSQPSTPETLAEHIAQSAPGGFLEKPDSGSYQAYADQLKETLLTQFDENARAKIFGQHATIIEQLLTE